VNWDNIRKQFELPQGVVYLNNGSFGPCPKPVLDATAAYLRDIDSHPGAKLGEYWGKLKETKKRLGAFVAMDPEDFVFVTNVTMGMSMISRGLRVLEEGDEILTTSQEYGAVNNAWEFVARKRKLTIRTAVVPSPPESAEQIVDIIKASFTDRTRVLYFSHITTTTGLILPVREICAAARERGILTAIDGAHAPGMIPLDVAALGADFYTGNCHKWLCAPKGTGFLWVRKGAQDMLDPLIVGWGWDKESDTFLGNFENPGTHSSGLPVAVGDAVAFQEAIGKETIAARGRELTAYGRGALEGISGTRSLTPSVPGMSNSLTAYALPLGDHEKLKRELEKRNIIIPNGPREDDTWLRLSTHVYNTREEIDLLVQALGAAYAVRRRM
jgi:isopenicillin-N epimerase